MRCHDRPAARPNDGAALPAAPASWVVVCRNHQYGAPFIDPVDPIALGIPDYFDVVKHPMDLSTVMKGLRDNSRSPQQHMYRGFNEFAADVRLIFDNCLLVRPTPATHLPTAAASSTVTGGTNHGTGTTRCLLSLLPRPVAPCAPCPCAVQQYRRGRRDSHDGADTLAAVRGVGGGRHRAA